MMKVVRDIMKTPSVLVRGNTLVCEVNSLFLTNGVSGIPLVEDDGKCSGFVSSADVIRFYSTGQDPYYARLHEIASRPVITINPSATITDAAKLMLEHRINHLVVTEDETVVGALSSFAFAEIVSTNREALD